VYFTNTGSIVFRAVVGGLVSPSAASEKALYSSHNCGAQWDVKTRLAFSVYLIHNSLSDFLCYAKDSGFGHRQRFIAKVCDHYISTVAWSFTNHVAL
jgi:hypothetical protein